jgi:hypothetical protein
LSDTHAVVLAVNSLWAWHCPSSPNRRQKVGRVESRHTKHSRSATARTREGEASESL